MPRGLRQVALSISCLSPIVRRPDSFRCHEDRVTHFPGRTTVLGFNFLPKLKASKLEFRKFFFDLPAQAVFIAFSRALAPSGKHPQPIAFSSYEKHASNVSQPPVSTISPFLSTTCRITYGLSREPRLENTNQRLLHNGVFQELKNEFILKRSCEGMSVVGTNRTSRAGLAMSVEWGRPEVTG
jgi:hypothetical protein